MDLKQSIRTIPDWPHKGIMFRDITTLMENAEAFAEANNQLYERYKNAKIDKVAGIDARGFIFGAVLAYKLNVGFIPIRKKGKLPFATIEEDYSLEYGKNTLELHADAIKEGENIVIIDDLIATGGTVKATINLIEKLKGKVYECAFVIELPELKGREKLKGYNVFSLVEFEGE
jgi:adenine phosphoribosyltransferase